MYVHCLRNARKYPHCTVFGWSYGFSTVSNFCHGREVTQNFMFNCMQLLFRCKVAHNWKSWTTANSGITVTMKKSRKNRRLYNSVQIFLAFVTVNSGGEDTYPHRHQLLCHRYRGRCSPPSVWFPPVRSWTTSGCRKTRNTSQRPGWRPCK